MACNNKGADQALTLDIFWPNPQKKFLDQQLFWGKFLDSEVALGGGEMAYEDKK